MAGAALAALLLSGGALAQSRIELWDVKIGTPASELPDEAFTDFACGTNGGPPSLRLSRFADYRRCRPEASGLFEVYARYDDEDEYRARARGLKDTADHFGGTRISIHPTVISVLFDPSGIVRGLRAVTDDRASLQRRGASYRMADDVRARFGLEEWSCQKIPLEADEELINGEFVKENCRRLLPEGLMLTQAHLFRKPGQSELDPHSGEILRGQFKSWSRVELLDPKLDERTKEPGPMPSPPAPVAVSTHGSASGVEAFKADLTKDCPGCDLSGANLRFRDLTGANLAGAKLTGANLLGAKLARSNCANCDLEGANLKRADLTAANLTGARLTRANLHTAILRDAVVADADLADANLNRVEATRIRLPRSRLDGAMLYAADLSGADLSGAMLKGALAGHVRLRQGKLSGIDASTADFTEADLGGADLSAATLEKSIFEKANLKKARLVGSKLRDARLPWSDLKDADLREANLVEAILYRADLRRADLRNADLSGAVLRRAYVGQSLQEGAILKGTEMPDGDVHE